jgi:transposase-like protein
LAQASHVASTRLAQGWATTLHLDEVFVSLLGEPLLLWRAVDEHAAQLAMLAQKQRDKAAAERLFSCDLHSCPASCKIVTDQLRSYPTAKASIPERANVIHMFEKAATRLNNRAENNHQPTRERARCIHGFRVSKRPWVFLSSFERSCSTTRSSEMCCALRPTENGSLRTLSRGIAPNPPEIRYRTE